MGVPEASFDLAVITLEVCKVRLEPIAGRSVLAPESTPLAGLKH